MNLKSPFRWTAQAVKKGVQCLRRIGYVKHRELVLATILLVFLASIAFGDQPLFWASFSILGLYALFALWFWMVRFVMRFRSLKPKMRQLDGIRGSPIKFELQESAAVFTAGEMRWEIQWRKLRRVVEADDVLLLLWDEFNFTMIPREQLSDEIVSVIRQNVRK